jgi:hypothetical protein
MTPLGLPVFVTSANRRVELGRRSAAGESQFDNCRPEAGSIDRAAVREPQGLREMDTV